MATSFLEQFTKYTPNSFFSKSLALISDSTKSELDLVSAFEKLVDEYGISTEDLEDVCADFFGCDFTMDKEDADATTISVDAETDSNLATLDEKSFCIKATPGLYTITELGDVKDAGTLIVSGSSFDARDISLNDQKCTSKTKFDEVDNHWHTKGSFDDGTNIDLVFFIQAEDGKSQIVFSGSLTSDKDGSQPIKGVQQDARSTFRALANGIGGFSRILTGDTNTTGNGTSGDGGNGGSGSGNNNNPAADPGNGIGMFFLYAGVLILGFLLLIYFIRKHKANMARVGLERDPENPDPDNGGNRGGRDIPTRTFQQAGYQPRHGRQGHTGGNNNRNHRGRQAPLEVPSFWAVFDGLRKEARHLKAAIVFKITEPVVQETKKLVQKSFSDRKQPSTSPQKLIFWDQILPVALKQMKSPLDTPVDEFQAEFISNIKPYVATSLQGTLALTYSKTISGFPIENIAKVVFPAVDPSAVITKGIDTGFQTPSIKASIATEARSLSYSDAVKASPDYHPGSPNPDVEAFRLQQDIEKASSECQTRYTKYLSDLEGLITSGKITVGKTDRTISASIGLDQMDAKSFAPLAPPSNMPGVPLWLLLMPMGGKSVATKTTPTVGTDPTSAKLGLDVSGSGRVRMSTMDSSGGAPNLDDSIFG